MFIWALFTIAKTWKKPRCLSTDEWINNIWCDMYIHTHTHTYTHVSFLSLSLIHMYIYIYLSIYLSIYLWSIYLSISLLAELSTSKDSACSVGDLGSKDPLEEDMAIHFNILAWRIPMDRAAWLATIHGVTKSWTWLNN